MPTLTPAISERDMAALGSPARTPTVAVSIEGHSPIWCKMEFAHESGSTKDRIARYILTDAISRGLVAPGGVVAEASSGSTSIAMACICARLGLHFIAVMPEGVSSERVLMIRAYGAEVRLSPAKEGIRGALAMTELLRVEAGAFLPRQFENQLNADAHRLGTARELVEQLAPRHIDAFVSGVGTGGTLVGAWRGLLEAGMQTIPVLARPIEATPGLLCSCFAQAECSCFSARIPGVLDGASAIFVPAEMPGLIEEEIPDSLAIDATRALIRAGYPVGPSSGLNMVAAWRTAKRLGPDAVVATVLCDRAERYFSTELFAAFR